MSAKSIIFLGAGSAAREFFWFYHDLYPDAPVAFVDDVSPKTELLIHGVAYPVVKDWDFGPLRAKHPEIPGAFTEFLIGVSDPRAKQALVAKALAHGLLPAPTCVSQQSVVRPDCTLGRGGMVISCTFSSAASVGDYATIILSTMGSDARAGDYVTAYTGCHIASDVVLGEGVSLGASTAVMVGVKVAPWVVSGQSASIVKDIPEKGITVVGVPARKLERKPNTKAGAHE